MNTTRLTEQQKLVNKIEAQSKIVQLMLEYIVKGDKQNEVNDKNN